MAASRLLLIEDDYDVAEMLQLYFQAHEYEVFHAGLGQEGVELARTRFPNLILLDVMLPDMDGYDVCVSLRHTAMTRYIPILFLTQRGELANKVRGLELGADDYITKPFDIDELRLRVERSIFRATRENLHEARTGLPTGELVHEELRRRQQADQPFEMLIFHLDGLQIYSEVYGFLAAHDLLKYGGRLVQKQVSEHGTSDDFVGILDDAFVVLTHSVNPERLQASICDRFNAEATAFYSFSDVERGGMLLNTGGDQTLIPLMTMTAERRPVSGDVR